MSRGLHGPLDAAALRDGLSVRRVGRHILCLDETGSTNDDAFDLARLHGSAADGWAVFAERQVRGRGRQGRRWLSPRGAGIHCSVLLCEKAATLDESRLALVGGVAAALAVRETTDAPPEVRWPNDLFIRGKKAGGVLVERRVSVGAVANATVIGIGINCLQQRSHFDRTPDITQAATSLEIESSHAIDRTAVARALLRALDGWLGSEPFDGAALTEQWRSLSGDAGRRVTLEVGGARYVGRMVEIDPDARMTLEDDAGRRMSFDPRMASVVQRHET